MTIEPVWEIPQPLSTCDVVLDDDTVTSLRRHGNPNGPRLVMSHGNGLAIDLYYPFWSLLATDFDLVIYDLRNHGWNGVGPREHHNVPTLIRDQQRLLDAIDRRYGDKPKTAVYHSVSALVTLLSSSAPELLTSVRRSPLAAQVLLDPTLCRPGVGQVELEEASQRAAQIIRRRGFRFQSREDFADFLGYVPSFARVLPGVRELMARTTLRKSADGQDYELRCPRDYEAQIMEFTRTYCILVDLGALPCPTKVIGGDPTLPYAYLPSLDLGDMTEVDYDFVPETTHLLPLEQPAECVALIREFLAANGLL